MEADVGRAPEPEASWAPLAALFALFALSRIAVHALGIRFDASPLTWYWQFIDPELLRNDLLRSVAYHHAQPPLFNLYLGSVLKVAAEAPTEVFRIVQLGFGWLLTWCTYRVLIGLGLRAWPAAGAALAFAISPSAILYENWLFYTQPVAALLIASAAALHRTLRRGDRASDAALFFTLLACIALTRSLFHLVWLLLVVALVSARARDRWRPVALAGLVPVLLVFALYSKNLALFGTFSASSWFGMSLARVATESQPADLRRELVVSGHLSPASLIPPFSNLARYPAELQRREVSSSGVWEHPVLSKRRKSTQAPNFNHAAFLDISRSYERDAWTLVRRSPGPYTRKVLTGCLVFAAPASVYWPLNGNQAKIDGYERGWNSIVYGVLPGSLARAVFPDREGASESEAERARALREVGWLWLALGSVSVLRALTRGLRDIQSPAGDRTRGWTLVYLALTCIYVAVLVNAVEYLENNRFRFLIEPMLWVLVAWNLNDLARGWLRKRAGSALRPAA